MCSPKDAAATPSLEQQTQGKNKKCKPKRSKAKKGEDAEAGETAAQTSEPSVELAGGDQLDVRWMAVDAVGEAPAKWSPRLEPAAAAPVDQANCPIIPEKVQVVYPVEVGAWVRATAGDHAGKRGRVVNFGTGFLTFKCKGKHLLAKRCDVIPAPLV